MNMKDFLRGLGAGIIFSALIMLVAYMTSGSYRISDAEIIKRAEKLGMVMQDKPIVAEDDDTADVALSTAEGATEATTEATTEASTEGTTEATTEATEGTTEATTEATEGTTEVTTEVNSTDIATDYITAEITVSKGMNSEQIAKLVQDAGIIDDYMEFDRYLNENGYSNMLSVNTFKLNSNMSYEEIAKELTKGDR